METLRATVCGEDNTDECSLAARVIQIINDNRGLLYLQLRMVATSLFIIYTASHGAIQRPHSAAPPKRKRKGEKSHGHDEDGDQTHQYAQSFLASDAIVFPITAGILLVSLYYLIKWLDDMDLLNTIFKWFLGIMSLASTSPAYAHAMEFTANLLFPNVWRDGSGQLYGLDNDSVAVWKIDESEDKLTLHGNTIYRVPLCSARMNQALNSFMWEIVHSFRDKWSLIIKVPGSWSEPEIIKFTLSQVMAGLIALFLTLMNSTMSSMTASNISGMGMAYGSLMIMSPTSLPIGTGVLSGLCIYDIIMVFYTPYMITVAKNLDAPIKLTFESQHGLSMLGLGDIIIPGIVIAMCLRLDLWRHYNAKIVKSSVELVNNVKLSDGTVKTEIKTDFIRKKATYIDPTGRWGDGLWLRGNLTAPMRDARFKKTYFHAAIIGYALGMIVTLVIVTVFKHGQPALLYLVPSTLLTVWGTGALRGELADLWNYTEDGSLDTEDVIVTIGDDVIGDDDTSRMGSDKEIGTRDLPPGKSSGTRGESDTSKDLDDQQEQLFSVSVLKPERLCGAKNNTKTDKEAEPNKLVD